MPHELTGGLAPWMTEAVSGHPTLVAGGVRRDNNGDAGLCAQRHPRTALGLTRDRRTLIMAVVDGRTTGRIGMTCDELTNLLLEHGAHDAVNLDGGGSSALWMAGRGVLNRPSDGSLRRAGNHLGVFAHGAGAAPHCPAPRCASR
jgi:exopolysaccharide biosynthesis protein